MVAETVRTVKSPVENPFLGTLQAAHAEGLPVRICERIEGGRFTYQHSYPAALIDRFVTAPRRGTVVVIGNMTRVKVSNIVSVTVEMPGGAAGEPMEEWPAPLPTLLTQGSAPND